ncbi:MAG TPA: hypothetical protein VFM55_26830 [Micromonosporaceae bacterium]|nr:hypothetical protein [Micromonosporaceae bacterium]
MGGDVAAVAAAVVPFVSAAVGAYGAGVVQRVQEAAADDLPIFGQTLQPGSVHDVAGATRVTGGSPAGVLSLRQVTHRPDHAYCALPTVKIKAPSKLVIKTMDLNEIMGRR